KADGTMSIFKEIKTLLRLSIAEHGAFRTAFRCAVGGPAYAWHRLQEVRHLQPTRVSEFDRMFGVDTDGATNNTTYLRDLDLASPNWVHAVDYIPVPPDQCRQALSALAVPYEKFTFIDFGCGKGRAMLLAAERPFRRLIGVDFSPELLAVARRNWAVYKNPAQRCFDAEFVCADFLNYRAPASPALLFFFNPCAERVLVRVAENIRQDVTSSGCPVFIVYLSPQYRDVWTTRGFRLVVEDGRLNYRIYTVAADSR